MYLFIYLCESNLFVLANMAVTTYEYAVHRDEIMAMLDRAMNFILLMNMVCHPSFITLGF